jgi:hypothetical protein
MPSEAVATTPKPTIEDVKKVREILSGLPTSYRDIITVLRKGDEAAKAIPGGLLSVIQCIEFLAEMTKE